MKPRETRQSVLLPVRIRQEDSWGDARIRNLSSRGLLLQMQSPPERGSFIEIRRGQVVIIGQVRWAGEDTCGIRTQERVPVEQLKLAGGSPSQRHGQGMGPVERRVAVRVVSPEEAAQRSRLRARLFHNVSMAVVGAVGAWLAASLLYDVLALPIQAIAQRL